jgi:hypothetical protein
LVKDAKEIRMPSNHAPSNEETRRVRKALGVLGYGNGIDAGSDVGFSGAGPYHVLLHGLPFFNLNPNYGPVLSISQPPSEAIVFYASPELPPINTWRPKVKPSGALEKLIRWGHERALKRGLPAAVDPSQGDLVAELGYWKPTKQANARLVWRATKYSTVNGRRYGMGALRMFVDAITCDFIEPDDPAWGANP